MNYLISVIKFIGCVSCDNNFLFVFCYRSCVAFSDRNRILGVAAKNQMVTNIDNTIHGFKRLLGRSYNDPAVQQELRDLPYKVVKQNNGSIGIKV